MVIYCDLVELNILRKITVVSTLKTLNLTLCLFYLGMGTGNTFWYHFDYLFFLTVRFAIDSQVFNTRHEVKRSGCMTFLHLICSLYMLLLNLVGLSAIAHCYFFVQAYILITKVVFVFTNQFFLSKIKVHLFSSLEYCANILVNDWIQNIYS